MAEYTECIRKLEDPAAVLAQARSAMYPLLPPLSLLPFSLHLISPCPRSPPDLP